MKARQTAAAAMGEAATATATASVAETSAFAVSEAEIKKNPVYALITDTSRPKAERLAELAKLKAYDPALSPEKNAEKRAAFGQMLLQAENQVLAITSKAVEFTNDEAFSLYDQSIQKLILDEIRRDTAVFSPEYLDRNDEILCARELDLGSLQKIAAREVREIAEKIVRSHPDLSLDVPVADINAFVAANCASVSGRRTEMIVNKATATPLTAIALSGDKVKGRFSARFNAATNAFDTNFERASGIIMPKAAFADATPKPVMP